MITYCISYICASTQKKPALKKLLLLWIIGIYSLTPLAQINVPVQGTEVLSGFTIPSSVKLFGDDLFIADFYDDTLYKIDMSASSLNATPLLQGVNGIWDIERHGNDLYFTEHYSEQGVNGIWDIERHGNDLYFTEHYSNKLRKIDLTQNPPTIVDVVATGFYRPTGLLIYNDTAYLTDIANNKLYSVNITDPNPTVTLVLGAGLDGPTALERIGHEIYIANNGNSNNKIVKFDLNNPGAGISPVVSNVALHSIYGLNYKNDGYMYVSRFNGAELVRIDPTQANPTIEQVAFGIRLYDAHFHYKGTDYICGDITGNSTPDSKLFRLDTALDVQELRLAETVVLYPNPSQGLFYLDLRAIHEAADIALVSNTGRILNTVHSAGNELVRFYEKKLPPGLYFIHLKTTKANHTYKCIITP